MGKKVGEKSGKKVGNNGEYWRKVVKNGEKCQRVGKSVEKC